MRFLKKASIRELEQYSDIYKDFELFLFENDMRDEQYHDNVNTIKNLIKDRGIRISAVHCPKHDSNGNYLSVCEIMTDDDDRDTFMKICKFAEEISNNQAVTVIVHEGCDKLCERQENGSTICEGQELYDKFRCFIRESFSENRGETCQDNGLDKKGKSEVMLQIGVENIPPYTLDNKSCVQPMCHKNLLRREEQVKGVPKIGRVVDFCHILAEKHLTQRNNNFKEYLLDYMKQFEGEEILLFHLSNFNKETGVHGEVFHDTEDDEVFNSIFEYCMEDKVRSTLPITLEVSGNSSRETADRFNTIMMRWSKLHVLPRFKQIVKDEDKKFFDFFENLYQAFTANIETEADMGELFVIADRIRNYILVNYKSNENYPFGFGNAKQELDMYRFQIQAYIYYMQYMNTAFDLLDYYENRLKEFEFSVMLKNYMFHDSLGELKFDGLVGYYNIPWLMKDEVTLYHFYDKYEGDTEPNGTFKEEVACCMKHITEPDKSKEVISFGKAFGRCALKYYNPELYPVPNKPYHIRIAKVPVNCFYDGAKWIPLQAVKRTDQFMTDKQNYIIDFSEYYFGRGDKADEASFKDLYFKVTKEKFPNAIVGTVYDQEVIIKNTNGMEWQDYYLNKNDMLILLVFYKYLCSNKNRKISDIKICDQKREIYTILEQIDFEHERKFPPDVTRKGYYESFPLNDIYNELPKNINNYDEAQGVSWRINK